MSTDVELVEPTEQQLAVLDSMDLTIGGAENLDEGDIGMPPRLRISQQNLPMEFDGEKIAGVIANTLTGAYDKILDMVVLMYLPKTYVLWPEKFSTENEPVCKSNDGKGASSGTDMQPSASCAACPFSQFGEDGTKPTCAMQRNFLVWLVDYEDVAILTLSSTALRQARVLTSLAQRQGLRKSIRMSLLLKEESQGTWYVPVFRSGEKLGTKSIIALAEARNEMKGLVITADDDRAESSAYQPPVEDTPDSDMSF